jgi:sensor histidine kinase regulating citrate/malate metabolism
MTKESGGRILACTEKDFVRQALPRLGWVARGETPIVDKNGTDIGPTSVFEYVRPQTNA